MKEGREVLPIEVGGQTVLAVVHTKGGEENVALRKLSFDDFTRSLEAVASELTKVIEKVKPDQASVQLSASMAVQGGKLVALFFDATTTGSLTITLTWGKG